MNYSRPKMLRNDIPGLTLDGLREKYLKKLSSKTGRNVIAYYSGWLKSGKDQNVDINDSDITGFMNAINGMDCSKGLDLILHTPGGSPTATEGIVKYLHKSSIMILELLFLKWQCLLELCWHVLRVLFLWEHTQALDQ